MSYSEFLEWKEYYSDEPFLADRIENQLAATNTILSNTAGAKSKFSDFIISNKKPTKPTNVDNLTKQVKGLFG